MRSVVKNMLLASVIVLVSGCTVCTDCGSFRQSNDVTMMFESSEIVPGYNYYYNGELTTPKAIMGIDKSLVLQGRFWTPIDITPQQMTAWIDGFQQRSGGSGVAGQGRGYRQGAEIFDPQGNRVGVWYSAADQGVFKFPGGSTIVAYPPQVKAGAGINSSK